MKARILFVTDMHKKYTDMKSIRGSIPVQHEIQMDIIEYVKKAHVTHIVITGDWYDKGFHGLGPAYSAMEEDRLLSESVNGNVYICLGNHFYLERDENPEMYVIQPCEFMKPRNLLQLADKPIFNCVPQLRIGSVLISFFHYSKTNKNYIQLRPDDVTFHIGVYHDDRCVPGWVREREGFGGTSTNMELSAMYNNVDLAIHGHIHSKIGLTAVQLPDGRKVPLWIPGALGMTQNKESIKHTSVELPIVDIEDDNSVSIAKAEFSTHIDKLQFYKVSTKATKPTDITEVQKTSLPVFAAPSLPQYLNQFGFDDKQLALIEEASHSSLDFLSALRVLGV